MNELYMIVDYMVLYEWEKRAHSKDNIIDDIDGNVKNGKQV